jgi:hypothetical protein
MKRWSCVITGPLAVVAVIWTIVLLVLASLGINDFLSHGNLGLLGVFTVLFVITCIILLGVRPYFRR